MKGFALSLLFFVFAICLILLFKAMTGPDAQAIVSKYSPTYRELAQNSVLDSGPKTLDVVIDVIDGDTIELASGERVRYLGINAPEMLTSYKKGECYAREAKEQNKELVFGKKVYLIRDISDRDKYGRLLRYVYTEDAFVNFMLAEGGYAKAQIFAPDTKYASLLRAAQQDAQDENRGVWNICRKK